MIVERLSDIVLATENVGEPLKRAGIGCWEWDVTNDVAIVCPAAAAICGISEKTAAKGLRIVDLINCAHPDDRMRLSEAARESVARGGVCSMIFRTALTLNDSRNLLVSGWYEVNDFRSIWLARGIVVDLSMRSSYYDVDDHQSSLDQFAQQALTLWGQLHGLDGPDRDILEPILRGLLLTTGRRLARY